MCQRSVILIALLDTTLQWCAKFIMVGTVSGVWHRLASWPTRGGGYDM